MIEKAEGYFIGQSRFTNTLIFKIALNWNISIIIDSCPKRERLIIASPFVSSRNLSS